MLAVGTYTRAYIEACQAQTARQLAAFAAVSEGARKGGGEAAVAAFAPEYFNMMVLALDHYFMHRLRAKEGKDGNPINEVRILATALMEKGGVLTPDSTIKYDPERSITGAKPGERIRLTEANFTRLTRAYFDEVEKRYL